MLKALKGTLRGKIEQSSIMYNEESLMGSDLKTLRR